MTVNIVKRVKAKDKESAKATAYDLFGGIIPNLNNTSVSVNGAGEEMFKEDDKVIFDEVYETSEKECHDYDYYDYHKTIDWG